MAPRPGETIPAMTSRRSSSVPWTVIVAVSVGVVALGVLLLLRSHSAEPGPEPSLAAPLGSSSGLSMEALLAAPATSGGLGSEPEQVRAQLLSKRALADAIGVAKPLMSNTVGRLDVGSALLAVWASRSLTWETL